MHHQLKFNNCTLCPHCIYGFCIYLRTNSDLCHLQHKLIGFYNRDEKCLQRGTDWVFKYSGLRLAFKAYRSRDATSVFSFRDQINFFSYIIVVGRLSVTRMKAKQETFVLSSSVFPFSRNSICYVFVPLNPAWNR